MAKAAIPLLALTDLHISVEGTEIVRGIDLVILEGEIHAIMGPNGSGKSTLVNALMGHPKYEITSGAAMFKGKDLLAMASHERAQAGLFLAFQYPKEISGVTVRSFLFAAHKAVKTARGEKPLSALKFQDHLKTKMSDLKMDPVFAERFLNQGFSGGEKKKAEILQMTILEPSLALMDETDSGLDVDALKIVAEGVNGLRVTSYEKKRNLEPRTFSALIVTHYARILDYITPDRVHVMVGGRIVESGGPSFAKQLEQEGYAKYAGKQAKASLRLETE